jgi:hypothetical protein
VLWREGLMKRFVEGVDRGLVTLFPDRLEDWIGDDNLKRILVWLPGQVIRSRGVIPCAMSH